MFFKIQMFFVLLWLLFFCPTSHATMVVPLNLTQMSNQAEKIFRGKCLQIMEELDENQMPSTYVRFEVLDGLKGVSSGESVLIKQFGSSKKSIHVGEGEKRIVPLKSLSIASHDYEEGKEYLVFYYPESEWGFTSPVGAGQGLFEITTDKKGEKQVLNPLDNRFLKEISREHGLLGPAKLLDVESKVQALMTNNP